MSEFGGSFSRLLEARGTNSDLKGDNLVSVQEHWHAIMTQCVEQ